MYVHIDIKVCVSSVVTKDNWNTSNYFFSERMCYTISSSKSSL